MTDDKEKKEQEASFVTRSMDRFLEKQTAESIRQTMQAQEDIFKQQVRELHRVYNTQKMMMDQLKHRSQYWTNSNKDQTGTRERTGSCSGVDLENMVRAAKATTTDHIDESELELTLSIGMSSSSTNKDMDYSSTTSLRSSSDNCNNQSNNNNNNNSNNQESSGPNTPMSSSSTTSLDREKKRPHWLFQGLSINRTS
ncbi:unnamed protein product [Microthlaspi erraticum]|uniref:Uncharacterized protein n=1 Tax=Microthlaspi erraticum TaxID=1685480 RepID=A0A6D2LBU8_9BRAS|nr:unnamed protein product [Microthlaspi erraticum]